jgi:predicted alpha/beta hydrolase family esterase
MKIADADILILPGLFGGSDNYWYSRWAEKLTTARQVNQDDWDEPDRSQWVDRLADAVSAAKRPVVLVGHSLGALTIVHAAPKLAEGKVKAAFLVAPPDLETLPQGRSFLPLPREPLPFPSFVIASQTDPYADYEFTDDMAAAWGSAIFDAGDAGHINADSGHGPWPEGLMMFARLMKQL